MSNRLPTSIAEDLVVALGGAVFLGALQAGGDWLWARYIPDGAVAPGVAHGVVVFLAIALLLAAGARRAGGEAGAARRLVLFLPVAGALIAAAFYPLYLLLGYLGSLLATWVAMWLVTAWLQRAARGRLEGPARTAARGGLAALGSGLAFWTIAGIWTSPDPEGPDLVRHFFAWSWAFLPGFAALLLGQPRAAGPSHDDQ